MSTTLHRGAAWARGLAALGVAMALSLLLLMSACGGGGSSTTTTTDDTPVTPAPTVTAPAIVTQPASATVDAGGSATLSVVASGTTPAYQWYVGGTAIAAATASSLVTGTAGTYTVVVSNSAGSVTSTAATVTVNAVTGGTSAWNLDTGAQAADVVDTSTFLSLRVALDTLIASSDSTRLTVGATSAGSTPVQLDGRTAVTLAQDARGLTITAALPAGTALNLVLSGSYAGSVTIFSDGDFALTLDGARIASPDGPAVNIQSAQRAFVTLAGSNRLSDSTTWSARTLPDGSAMDLKATLFSEGPLIFTGSGTLEVAAAAKHAVASDAHVRLRAGTLVLTAAQKDGVRANDAFVMDGGSLTIATTAGKGIKVEGKERTDRTPLGFIAVNAGTIDITSHDKAITASWEGDEDGDTTTTADDPDPRVTLNGGTINIRTTGTPYEDRNTADGDDSLSPEGIESKSTLTINGGTLTVDSTDDALNAGLAIVIRGGRIYARSSTNDAIDSNGTLTISGGIVVADGAAGAEGGLDCDQNTFSITGGVLVGIGGRNSGATLAATTQNTVSMRNVSAGLLVLRDAAGQVAFAFQVPESSAALLLSSPLVRTGTTYTVVTGGTLGAVGEDFHGLAVDPGTHSGGTAGSSFTVTRTVTSL